MRRPYDIYSKYKLMFKKAMETEIASKLEVCPRNCKYNKVIKAGGRYPDIPICMFGQHPPEDNEPIDVSKLITCSSVQQAQSCNAYTGLVADKKEALSIIKKEISDLSARRKRFPEIVALEWVMDNSLHEMKQSPPSLFKRFLFWIIRKLEDVAMWPNTKKRAK